ncbi:MAG: hypothetical protein QOG87_742, partial [Actinomycetota bacterium]
MGLTRRDFIKAGAATGAALLVARPSSVFGATGPQAFPTSRTSRLFPGSGTFVAHSDLHNHTLLSDGATTPQQAFDLMRSVQLDAAALTDHAVLGKIVGHACGSGDCTKFVGINEASWEEMAKVADANLADGSFVAMRGFEWTTGTIGHVNVWFSELWTDSMVNLAQSPKGIKELLAILPSPGPELSAQVAPVLDELPESATMSLFYEWLKSEPDRPVLGGGSDALAGFNHPNEYGNFEAFRVVPELVERMVSCEVLNMDRDFLFWGMDKGESSPINACLNAGWRVGMLGVSDEHFDKWGPNRARGGLWVRELTRAGVREAMEQRRMFATFEPGLRLDAAANGVQMGQPVPHTSGPVRFQLDLDRGPSWHGRTLRLQVLRPGETKPVIAHEQDVRLPTPSEPVIEVTVPVDIDDGTWALLRVTDPAQPADPWAPAAFKGAGRAIAYASPFFFVPGSSGVRTEVQGASAAQGAGTLAATGGD